MSCTYFLGLAVADIGGTKFPIGTGSNGNVPIGNTLCLISSLEYQILRGCLQGLPDPLCSLEIF